MIPYQMALLVHRPFRPLVSPYPDQLVLGNRKISIPLVVLCLDKGDEMFLHILKVGRYSRLTALSS